ncbi:2-oxo acid dehydrogenase subunit E2 [Streptomyces flaveolus]|uniref:2-oxo acid dehydrogenase subunit E2 n=1 Tax=Streptomyces flaveolus TaxID=67297 RepID=UPI0033C1BA66
MAELLRMPEVAAAATTAVLSAWPLAEGARFAQGDAVVVVETDKAEVEVPADADGVLLKTLVPPGTEVEVDSPIAVLGGVGEAVPDLDALLAGLGVAPTDPQNATTAVRRDVPDPERGATSESVPAAAVATGGSASRTDRVFSSPLARRMAREAGLDIGTIPGTGPGGRVVRRDVKAAIEADAAPPAAVEPTAARPVAAAGSPVTPAAGADGASEDIPHSRMRRAIAERLLASKRDAPHFYLRAGCRVDALLELRRQINENASSKVSVNDLLIKAVATAHLLVPEMNVIWTADAVRRFSRVDISVAIATDKGLVTPVLRNVAGLSASAVAAQVRTYADQARAGSLRQEDLEGGSITITNLGMFGVEEFSAIINPPQSAILAVGEARPEPVVVDGRLEVATMLRLVLSVDHRPIDGALAARWMKALTDVLENPIRILV